MGRLIVDAAASLDGYWADARGKSVFSAKDLSGSGLSGRMEDVCGAVVMSRRSFELSEDTDWIAEAYAAQTPVFVVTKEPPAQPPRGPFQFIATYAGAFAAARAAAGDKAVLVVGEAGAIRAAMRTGEAHDIWLRVVSCTLGQGAPLFEEGIPVENYFVSEMETTPDAVHMHLEKRLGA